MRGTCARRMHPEPMPSSTPLRHSGSGATPPAPMQEIRGGGSLGLRAPPIGRTSAAARVRSWSTAWTREGARHQTGASSPPHRRHRCDRAMALRARLDPCRGRLMSTPTCCGRAWRGDWLRPAARNCSGGEEKGREKRRGRAGFGPASTPSTAIYRGRWGRLQPRFGLLGRCGSGLREKRPSARKPSRVARYRLIWGSARVALRASPAAEHIWTVAV
jgi:hypothetical protein